MQFTKPKQIERLERIRRHLGSPCQFDDLCGLMDMTRNTMGRYIKHLSAAGEVRIIYYLKGQAVYLLSEDSMQ